jgi:hypothetical protein
VKGKDLSLKKFKRGSVSLNPERLRIASSTAKSNTRYY